MVILIDTNVLINYILNRPDPQLNSSIKIMRLCAEGSLEGCIALHSLSTIWYVMRHFPEEQRRDTLRSVSSILSVASADDTQVRQAIDQVSFHDFEDCLQSKCTETVDADCIITCNINDFAESDIPAATPDEFLDFLNNSPG